MSYTEKYLQSQKEQASKVEHNTSMTNQEYTQERWESFLTWVLHFIIIAVTVVTRGVLNLLLQVAYIILSNSEGLLQLVFENLAFCFEHAKKGSKVLLSTTRNVIVPVCLYFK